MFTYIYAQRKGLGIARGCSVHVYIYQHMCTLHVYLYQHMCSVDVHIYQHMCSGDVHIYQHMCILHLRSANRVCEG